MDASTIDLSRYRFVPGQSTVEDVDLDETVVIMDGQRYTEADAAADAEWFEQHPVTDAVRYRGLSRGGVSLSGDGSHSPRVTVSLPRDVCDRAKALADAEGMGLSKWVRRLVVEKVHATSA